VALAAGLLVEERDMMSDPKPIASLSGSLLARKGQAAPAMRRQTALVQTEHMVDMASMEDLGWNDMGHEPVAPGRAGLSPMGPSPIVAHPASPQTRFEDAVMPEVLRQQQDLAEEFSPYVEAQPVAQAAVESEEALWMPEPVVARMPEVEIAPKRAPVARAAAGSRGKAAFTLRLDAERHLKLRLVCAVRHRSAQQIVTEALDAFLAKQPLPAELNAVALRERGIH
jgi:hypothetical protein